jgi:competence protein ComEC
VAALAMAVLVVAAATRPDGRVHVTVLDIGQGDAILVTGPTGGRMLVDGGPDPDRLLVALDARVPPWDRRIDLVVLTHPHEDHVAGLPLVLARYRVGHVVETSMPGRSPGYEAFVAETAGRGVPSGRLAAGDRLGLDGIVLDVLWPDAGRVPHEPSDEGGAVNDASIVLLATFEGRRFLLTGDAEADVEELLVARGLPPVDLLKAGHHGSRTSTSEALVAVTRPRVAAISVGAGNDYGHPSREVLDRLASAGAAVMRTDLVGTIDVALGASGVEVRTERSMPATAGDAPAIGDPAALSYDRRDVRSVPRRRRRPPPRPRPAGLAPAPRARRGRDRRVAGHALLEPRPRARPGPGRGGRAPPRCRQGDPTN